METVQEIEKAVQAKLIREYQTAMYRGYVSRKTEGHVVPYKGRYGSGYCVYRPNWKSTRYSFVTYYVW